MGVLAQTQLLFYSALAFVWLNLKGMYPPELHSTNLDFDWFYRRAMPSVLQQTFSVIWRIDNAIRSGFLLLLSRTLSFLSQRYQGPSRLLSRTYPAGSMVLWVAVILATYLILSFAH